MTKRKKMRDNHFIDWRKNVCDSFSKLDGKRDMRERARGKNGYQLGYVEILM